MYKKLARIGPISCGIFYALLMLLMVLVTAAIGIILARFAPDFQIAPPGEPNPLEGLTAIVSGGAGMEVLLMTLGGILVTGFIAGFIGAILYNIVAMITGGIKIRTRDLYYDDI